MILKSNLKSFNWQEYLGGDMEKKVMSKQALLIIKTLLGCNT